MSDVYPARRPTHDAFMIYVGILTPSVAAIICFLALVSQKSRLPERMATHWSSGNTPDGFMSPMQSLITLLVVTVGCAQIGWFGVKTTIPAVHRRLLFVINIALAAFLIGLELGVTIPQLDSTNPAEAKINIVYPVVGALLGVAAALVGMRFIKDFDADAPVLITKPPAAKLPRGPKSQPASVTAGVGSRIFLVAWILGAMVLSFVNVFLSLTLLLCVPLLAIGYRTGIEVLDDEIIIFSGVGPLKLTQRIAIGTVVGAYTGHYHWGDGGGVGLRIGNDDRISAAARSGEAVKFDTTTIGYTVVVPDGASQAIVADINSRVDAWLDNHAPRSSSPE